MITQKSASYIEDLFFEKAISQAKPVIYATCGIPGAGKTTFVDTQLKTGAFPEASFILNPDRVMLVLPEYLEDRDSIGAQAAYEKWELPARDLAYALAGKAGQNTYHIIKDMGCANPLSMKFVKRWKGQGYGLTMYHIDCPIETAFERIDQREFKISRQEVAKRYDSLQGFLPEYKALADEFYSIENGGFNKLIEIAS